MDAVEETQVAPCKSSREARGSSKGERNVPVPWLTLLAFAEGFFRSFLGLIVSLLGFNRTLPLFSPRPPVDRSPALREDCGIDWTVSVSTVMFRVPSDCRDFVVVKAGKLFLGGAALDFCELPGACD